MRTLLVILIGVAAVCGTVAGQTAPTRSVVQTGIDVPVADCFKPLAGKRVGLANQQR